jgi:hypothetical protein
MSLSYTIDAKRRLIIVRAGGVLTEADVTRAREQLRSDPAFDREFDQLFDATDVEDIALSKEGMARLADTSILAPRSGGHLSRRRRCNTAWRACSRR